MFNLRTQSKIYLRETIKFWLKTIVALKPIFGKILLHKDWLFFSPHINAKTSTLRILFIFQWSVKLQLSDRGWVLKFQLEGDKVQWLQTLCGRTLIFLGKSLYKDIYIFFVHSGAPDLIYPRPSLYEHILWMHLEKNRTYACTFPVQRKEIDVVKVRFTMRYSSRKLSNDKVITTACNFWRQIACSFQVMSGNILFLGNEVFEIPPFFQTWPGDLGKKVHACLLRFSALKNEIAWKAEWRIRAQGLSHPIWRLSERAVFSLINQVLKMFL